MEENIYCIKQNKILKNNNNLIKTSLLILDFILINNKFVLLLESKKIKDDKNIFCYDLEGKLNWIIQESPNIHYRNYYTSIKISENDQLITSNINGIEAIVDLNTGKIINLELIK